jgi:phenol hydroxylase P1 protein
MQVDIRTANVKSIRRTFAHLERRFGDKVASRYQEATYDLQSETNFHYKPLWDPERAMYDRRRTALRMADWYALKDPRQFYYGTYTITRAGWQEGVERQLDFVDKQGLLENLPADQRDRVVAALIPLRHYEWGANTNNAHITAYGWGVAITQAAMMNTMDRLAMAQHLSRIGLLLDGGATGASLGTAKQHWLESPQWQGLRREIENMFVTRDWFELFIAQNLVADSIVHPLFFQAINARLAQTCGMSLLLVTEFLVRWYQEASRWVDAVVTTAAAESDYNRTLLRQWTAKWREPIVEAVRPLAMRFLDDAADEKLAGVVSAFDARAAKLGVL